MEKRMTHCSKRYNAKHCTLLNDRCASYLVDTLL